MTLSPLQFTAADKKWERNKKNTFLSDYFLSQFSSMWSDKLSLTKVIMVFLATAAYVSKHFQIEAYTNLAAVLLKPEHFVKLNVGYWHMLVFALWCVFSPRFTGNSKTNFLVALWGN